MVGAEIACLLTTTLLVYPSDCLTLLKNLVLSDVFTPWFSDLQWLQLFLDGVQTFFFFFFFAQKIHEHCHPDWGFVSWVVLLSAQQVQRFGFVGAPAESGAIGGSLGTWFTEHIIQLP